MSRCQRLGLLRVFPLSQLKGCSEVLDLSASFIGYGTGYIHTVSVIIPSKEGHHTWLYKGSELHDHEKLLTGCRKVHRNVEMKSEKEIGSQALKQLIEEAINT